MEIQIVRNSQRKGAAYVELHKPGCQDTECRRATQWDLWIEDHETLRDFQEVWCSDFATDEGITPAEYVDQFGGEDVHINPCLKGFR